jgi:hypothetical protein
VILGMCTVRLIYKDTGFQADISACVTAGQDARTLRYDKSGLRCEYDIR